MRVLNTRDKKTYSKFSVPGFRTGSLVKKIIACFYYLSVLFFTVYSLWFTLSGDFANGFDVILAVIVELLIVGILIAPVIALGFSDYYDWHGIKLVLIVLISWCVLFTAANYVSSFFSSEFINSTNMGTTTEEILSDSSSQNEKEEPLVDNDIIKDNIEAQ